MQRQGFERLKALARRQTHRGCPRVRPNLLLYCRICKGQESVDLHIQYVAQVVPPKGSVRLLSITDMQYARMLILVGQKKLQENIHQQLLLF